MHMQNVWGGETNFITGDVQMAIGTKSRLWGLAAIVGVEENGSDIKRDGMVFCFIICHLGKKNTQWHFSATLSCS